MTPVTRYVLLGVALLLLLLLVYLILTRRATRSDNASASTDEAAQGPQGSPDDDSYSYLRQSFASAFRLFKQNVPSRTVRNQTPWYLLVGPAGSGKTALLEG